MIIVSNTTPIRYLVEIEKVFILESLFGKVIIPEKVAEELQHEKTPVRVREWIKNPPAWLEIAKADVALFTPQIIIQDGETEAISLALELNAAALLMDDKNARKDAKRAGLFVTPTLTLLEQAAERELIDLDETIRWLMKTTFCVSRSLVENALKRDRQRKSP